MIIGLAISRAQGVQIQRTKLPVEDKRPKVPDGGGSGVSAQRDKIPAGAVQRRREAACSAQRDQIPRCTTEPGGQGVSMQRVSVRDQHTRHVGDNLRTDEASVMQRASS